MHLRDSKVFKKKHFFCVCIIAIDSSDATKDILNSVFSQITEGMFQYSVIIFDISDGYSVYDYIESAKKNITLDCFCIRSHIKSHIVLKNYAFRISSGAYTAFLGPECKPSARWLLNYFLLAKSNQVLDMAYGPVLLAGKNKYASANLSLCGNKCIEVKDNFIISNSSFFDDKNLFDLSLKHIGRESIDFFSWCNKKRKNIEQCTGAVVYDLFTYDFKAFRRHVYYQGNYLFVNAFNGYFWHDFSHYLYVLARFIVRAITLLLITPFMLFDLGFFWRLFFDVYRDFGFCDTIRDDWSDANHFSKRIKHFSRKSAVPYYADFFSDQDNKGAVAHICVCVATYRRQELLAKLLEDLLRQDTMGLFTYSIVVVDNDNKASARSTVELFTGRGGNVFISYFIEPIRNIAMARNRCIDNSKGDYVAFVDDDESVGRDWLLHLIMTIYITNADAVGGDVYCSGSDSIPRAVDGLMPYAYQKHSCGEVALDYLCTNNSLFKKSLFDDGNMRFDPKFGLTGGEDTMLTHRLKKNGCIFSWSSCAQVVEHVDFKKRDLFWILKRFFRYGITRATLCVDGRGFVGVLSVLYIIVIYASSMLRFPFVIFDRERRNYYIYRLMHLFGMVAFLFGIRVKCY